MSARDVYDQLQRTVPALLGSHKYPMGTIYTILARLVYYGEAIGIAGDDGQRAWRGTAERQTFVGQPRV
jgi:hypothetical protein